MSIFCIDISILKCFTFDLAAVGVLTKSAKDLFIKIDIVGIHGTVEGQGDHLGNIDGLQFAGDSGTIGGAETVGQTALSGITFRSAVGIGFHGCF